MNIKKILYDIYWWLQDAIVPTFRCLESTLTYEDILNSYVNHNIQWLDLGCGHHILPIWRSEEEKQLVTNCKMIVGIDHNLPSLRKHSNISLRVRGNLTNLPFDDNIFDLITANMVLEHLDSPTVVLKEINRILKPEGIFIFHTPNAHSYKTILARIIPGKLKLKFIHFFEGRQDEDIFNTYYRINTKRRIDDLAKITFFENVKIIMCVSTAEFIIIPPFAILELIWIRILMKKQFEALRTNIIAILKKHNKYGSGF